MQKRINVKVLGTVATIAIMGLSLMGIAGGRAGAQDTSAPVNSISVTGSGESYGAPDVAYVSLGTDTKDSNVGTAVDQANTNLAAIVEAIKAAGVAPEDIQTANFNVYPEDIYNPQTGTSTGERVYHVSQTINITVRDIAQAGAVIDAGLTAGANTVNGLSFGIADTTALEQEARLKAVEDAKQRANELAAAFGVTVGDPIIISEVNIGGGYPITFARNDMAAGIGGAAPTQIQAGQLSVSVTVSVTFAISK